nr:hypothetical protein [Tanacetum cinerariifolium]
MSYDDEGPSFTLNHPRTQKELTRKEMEEDLYERIMLLNERSPIIKTLKYSDKYKKLLDSVLLDKLKLDGEFELEDEMVVRNVHTESDSDDDEDYCLKRDDTGKPFYGLNRAKYLNCEDPMDQALSL